MAGITDIGSRRRRNPTETRELILQTARQLIAERGPEALRISDVAHAAGVNRTTAYQHFRTRDELIAAAMASFATTISEMIDERRDSPNLIQDMIEYHAEHPEIARLWMYQLLSESAPPDRSSWQRYLDNIQELAASDRAQPGIDADMLAVILLTSTMGSLLALRRYTDEEPDRKEVVERFTGEFLRMLLHGVMKPEQWPELADTVRRATAKRAGEPS